jgi:ribosome-binding factor A
MNEVSMRRTESHIIELISTLLVQGAIKDPRLSKFISISGIKLAKDLSFAKVFVSTFEDEKTLETSVMILNNASGVLQSRIGKSLKTRHTPKLLFVKDVSIREAIAVNRKIEDLKN